MRDAPTFDQIVFSGGGLRCFWQGGFMDVARDHVAPDPERLACVSGGVLSAGGFLTRRGRTVLEAMTAAFEDEARNATLRDAVTDDGLTPHQRVYRSVVEEVLGDAEARDAVADGIPAQAILAHPPGDARSRLAAGAAALIYEAELHVLSRPDMEWAQRAGLGMSRVDMRKAARRGLLVELVCAAATIPPAFDISEWEGRPVIDGGMATQAPMPEPDEGPTLVLLTRAYSSVPEAPGRVFVQPSGETAADKIDFTDPGKLRATWEQGEADARAWLAEKRDSREEGAWAG